MTKAILSPTVRRRPWTPRATYRLQFNEHFRLPDALALVPYLQELGISHVYASPLFQARPHSTHGYDVCDYNRLNPEIGTETDLEKLAGELHRHDMGLVLDIVPNHMGIGGPENRWWWDVLARGQKAGMRGILTSTGNPPDPAPARQGSCARAGRPLRPRAGQRVNCKFSRRTSGSFCAITAITFPLRPARFEKIPGQFIDDQSTRRSTG